jgi:hypothetical protein
VDSNTLVGADANFATSDFLDDRNLRASAWGLGTFDGSDSDGGEAFGASISYPNDVWSWNFSAKQIGDEFDPALGFVPRVGIRKYSGWASYTAYVDREIWFVNFSVEPTVVTDLDDDVESAELATELFGIVWQSGDELMLAAIPTYERLDQDFEIEDGVTIPAGEYDWIRWHAEGETALKRPVSGGLAVEVGDFFDGTRLDGEASVSWRPSRHFAGELGYEESWIDLPDGNFVVRLASARLDAAVSPDLTWSNFLQVDNESDSLGWNSRLQWILEPGEEVTFVFNNIWTRDRGTIASTAGDASLKLQYTIRF